jgi:hypothetical protein
VGNTKISQEIKGLLGAHRVLQKIYPMICNDMPALIPGTQEE